MSKKRRRKERGYMTVREMAKNMKRDVLDMLMSLGLDPVPYAGGWISYNCPSCLGGKGILHCDIYESFCHTCRKIHTVTSLFVNARKGDESERQGEGFSYCGSFGEQDKSKAG